MGRWILWIAVVFLFSITFVQATSQGLEPIKVGNCAILKQECSNCSWVNISSVTYPNSTMALNQVGMAKSGITFTYTFCDTNATGIYTISGWSDADGNPPFSYDLPVRPNGEDATIGGAILYIGLLLILVVFLIGTVTIFMETDNLLVSVGTLGGSYLLITAISFIGWNMAKDFLTSSPFLVEMLRIIFMVFIIGLFPLLVGAFAYYFIMLFKIKEIERLMGKGFSEEDARRRTK